MDQLPTGFAILLLAVAAPALAQAPPDAPPPAMSATKPAAASGRLLNSPREMLRGFTDFEYAPPTNEPDLGRCIPSTGNLGGAKAPCADFARYMVSGYLEVQPFARTALRRLFVFAQPRFSFGSTVPGIHYSEAFSPIACENLMGLGVELSRSFEFRAVQHKVYWMGSARRAAPDSAAGFTPLDCPIFKGRDTI